MSAQAPTLKPDDPIPGTKYRVVRTLGAGGMGVVFHVVKPPNIQGVLKLMSAELIDHKELRTRFFDEVRILAQLDHPNIVKVFDYDTLPDGTPFYVMEVLNGRTVRDVLTTIGRVPPRVAYEVTRQLLEALQCAHTHEVPVIHRDIKPENIFLHAPKHGEPLVKLIDFGVSAVADRKHDGSFVGTWSYAAPEQIRGEAPTPATDLYSAALVLYELLCGRGPFDHYDDWIKISEAQLEEIPAPVSKFAPWVPSSIVGLIATSLAKDPRKRPRDAYAFSERLFELEWASDGKNPHDFTSEGPSRSAPKLAVAAPAPPHANANANANANAKQGPLSIVLSTVTAANPSSKKMAAAQPAADRLGDVPLIGVPPESVKEGPTWKGGFDLRDQTAPDTTELLAGLRDPTRDPPSQRGRRSDPDLVGPPTPRPTPVIVRTAPAAVSANDTFSSQHVRPRVAPRSRVGAASAMLVAALMLGLTLALVLAVRGRERGPATTPPRAAESAAAPASSPAVPAVSVSVAAPVESAGAAPQASAPASASVVAVPSARPARPTPHPVAHPSAPASGRGDYMRGLP